MKRCALFVWWCDILLVWAGFYCLSTSAKYTPFLDQGFLFDWNPPNQPVPIPVTVQCETLHIQWGRRNAEGPNPTAPYYLQIYTSTMVTPFVVYAGTGLSFDWDVPFAPGTQYQICMFDTNGITGGCQAIYTVIQNTTVTNPTCQNLTTPDLLRISGAVDNGPMSQYGFVDQCTDISITPLSGSPPYTLTVAPSLHPPYNITSHTMDAINWTVSLSWAFPFFLSLVSSEGLVWANGPMHSGKSRFDDCLAPNTVLRSHAEASAAGAAVGGLFGGALLVVGVRLFIRYRTRFSMPRIRNPIMKEKQPSVIDRFLTPAAPRSSDVEALRVPDRAQFLIIPPRSSSAYTPQNSGRQQHYGVASTVTAGASDVEASNAGSLRPGENSGPADTLSAPPSIVSRDDDDSSTRVSSLRTSPQQRRAQLRVVVRDSRVESQFEPSPTQPIKPTQETRRREQSQVYVLHHDGGRAPSYPAGAQVVELPPTYESGRNDLSLERGSGPSE